MPTFPNLNATQLVDLLRYLKDDSSAATTSTAGDKQEMGSPPAAETALADPKGEAAYKEHCAICHGEHREGIPPSFPMLIGAGQRLTKDQLVGVIHQGRGRMPGFPKLPAEELDSLLRFLGVSDIVSETAEASTTTTAPTFTGYRKFLDPENYPAIAPPWGTLNAIDLNTGKYLWKIPFGTYPELVAKGMSDTGSDNYGGPVVTDGGLLFIGASVFDQKFHAYDKTTGKLLWETELPFSGLATPATYMVNGKQYVVIAAGGGQSSRKPSGGVYIAFALP